MKDNRYTLRALAQFLGYPDQALRNHLPELLAAIDKEAVVPAARRDELHALAADILRLDTMEAEARYVETFDRGRATSLHMFEHVHGDSRDRGPAMVDLAQTYEKAGLFLSPEELPDHLCVVLEFASTQPPKLAAEFLGEMAHILNTIFSALLKLWWRPCWKSRVSAWKRYLLKPTKRWTMPGRSQKRLTVAAPRVRPAQATPSLSTLFVKTPPSKE